MDAIWPNKVQKITDFVNSESSKTKPRRARWSWQMTPKCTNFQVIVQLFELAFDTVIAEDIIHSGIPNYTPAVNSLKIQFLSQ